jgi:integrase
MVKLNLAREDIKAKTPPKKYEYFVTDTVEGRLLMRIYPSGKRAFHYSNGLVDDGVKGKKRNRPVLAAFEETTVSAMRKKVQEYNRRRSNNENPFAADLQKLTLNIFLDSHFMPKKQMPVFKTINNKSVRVAGVSEREYRNRMSMINKHIRPAIGEIKLKDMTYSHVDQFLTHVKNSSMTQARNIRVFLIDAWKEALRQHSDLNKPNFFEMWDIKALNDSIEKAKKDKRPLDVDLDEGTAMYNAIEAAIETNPLIARCIKLIYLTASGKGDIRTLQWDQIEFDKNREMHYFKEIQEKKREQLKYFGTDSWALIQELKEVHKQLNLVGYTNIFPQFKRNEGVYVDKPITEAMLRTVFEGSGHGKITGILGAAGSEAPTLLGTNKIPKFTLHNFRDTAASGISTEEGQLALGHKSKTTTEQYYKEILKKELSANANVREGNITSILNAKKS